MKKIKELTKLLVLSLAFFIGNTDFVMAEDTDISGIDNVVYIAPFEARQGSEFNLSVRMKNSVGIRGYEFVLTLPDGMTFVKNNNDMYIFNTNTDRAPNYGPTGNTSDNNRTSKVLGSTMAGVDISGNDGEILTVRVSVDSNMGLGDHTISLTNIILGTSNTSVSYETTEVNSTVSIVDYVVLDENSTETPVGAENTKVKVARTINKDHWSTICLPFAMTENQVKAAFGDDVKLGNFTGYDTTEDGDNIVGITVNFENATAIEANHPYIIKVSSAITEFTADGVTIDPVKTPKVSCGTKKRPADFIGTYVADFDFYNAATSYPLFLSDNKFWYATVNTKKMKAFRGFFDFYDYLPEAEGAEARVKMSFSGDGNTTNIDPRTMETIETGKVYNMAGQYVGEAEDADRLPKGIYIVNGKKKVIK